MVQFTFLRWAKFQRKAQSTSAASQQTKWRREGEELSRARCFHFPSPRRDQNNPSTTKQANQLRVKRQQPLVILMHNNKCVIVWAINKQGQQNGYMLEKLREKKGFFTRIWMLINITSWLFILQSCKQLRFRPVTFCVFPEARSTCNLIKLYMGPQLPFKRYEFLKKKCLLPLQGCSGITHSRTLKDTC